MQESQRRVYRNLAFGFIGVAALFSLVALAERVFKFHYFSGNVLPVTAFLGLIGLLLLQTVRQAGLQDEPQELQDEDTT